MQWEAGDDDSVSDRNKNSINIKYFQYTQAESILSLLNLRGEVEREAGVGNFAGV